jgi:hypothetical protein
MRLSNKESEKAGEHWRVCSHPYMVTHYSAAFRLTARSLHLSAFGGLTTETRRALSFFTFFVCRETTANEKRLTLRGWVVAGLKSLSLLMWRPGVRDAFLLDRIHRIHRISPATPGVFFLLFEFHTRGGLTSGMAFLPLSNVQLRSIRFTRWNRITFGLCPFPKAVLSNPVNPSWKLSVWATQLSARL